MKKGLILEGGAMRGLFSAGIMDVMMEAGISFDGIIGVSAGAAFGCNYKSGQIGRVLRYNTKYCRDKRFCSFSSLIKTGDLYGAEFCYKTLPEELDAFDYKAYAENPVTFTVVCTDIDTGKPIYKQLDTCRGDEMEYMRASASMPLVSRIVETDGLRMLDGGISDSVPLEYFESCGYEKNIVILTRPCGYRKEKSSSQWLVNFLLRKYPHLTEALTRRHEMYNAQLEYAEKAEAKGRCMIIRPSGELPVSRISKDAEKLRETYRLGQEAGSQNLERIREYLEK